MVDLARAGLLDRLLGALFPSRCLGCEARGVDLCAACRPELPWLGADVCPFCARPTRRGWVCGRCTDDPERLDGVRGACRMEGAARRGIHELKYRGARARAELLASLMAEAVARRPLAVDVLVPVPLSGGRRRKRGFNQSELLADRLGRHLGVPVDASSLTRVRETPPQVGQSAEARQANVAGAFAWTAPRHLEGQRVGLVDDVMTTGATLHACATVLRAAGAGAVYGLVVARET